MSDDNSYQDPFNNESKQDPFDNNRFSNQSRQETQIPVPNASAVLVLGILSILGSFCYGIPGLILAIIGLALGVSPTREYRLNPNRYTDSSYSTLKAGKICSIIGLVLALVVVVVFVIFFLFVAAKANEPFRYQQF